MNLWWLIVVGAGLPTCCGDVQPTTHIVLGKPFGKRKSPQLFQAIMHWDYVARKSDAFLTNHLAAHLELAHFVFTSGGMPANLNMQRGSPFTCATRFLLNTTSNKYTTSQQTSRVDWAFFASNEGMWISPSLWCTLGFRLVQYKNNSEFADYGVCWKCRVCFAVQMCTDHVYRCQCQERPV